MGSVKLLINGRSWPYTNLTIRSPTSSNIGAFDADIKCPNRNISDLLGPVEVYRDGEIIFKGFVQEVNPSLRDVSVSISGDSIDFILTSTKTTAQHKYNHKRVDQMVIDLMQTYLPDIDTSGVEEHDQEYVEVIIDEDTQLYDALKQLAQLENSIFYLKPYSDKTVLIFKKRGS